jgi:hypothetical protein
LKIESVLNNPLFAIKGKRKTLRGLSKPAELAKELLEIL